MAGGRLLAARAEEEEDFCVMPEGAKAEALPRTKKAKKEVENCMIVILRLWKKFIVCLQF